MDSLIEGGRDEEKKGVDNYFMPVWALLVVAGCESSGCGTGDNPEPVDNDADYALPGNHTACTYTDDLSDSRYHSARMHYPCTGSGPFGATTLVDGRSKENVWVAEHLASHGIAVLSITADFSEVVAEIYENAHKGGIATLRAESGRGASPVYRKIHTGYLQVLGADRWRRRVADFSGFENPDQIHHRHSSENGDHR